MSYRIVQLTDCHLFADAAHELRGVATRPRFLSALETVRQQFPDADLIVLTGDTAHDELTETYAQVRHALGDLIERVRVIPGNHDNRAALRDVFPQATTGPADRVTFECAWGEWRMIGLDSQRPGESPGTIGDEQHTWLRTRLQSAPRQTLLFVHHPPIDVGSPWLDRIGLQDANELQQIAADHGGLRLVCCGHVHQELAGRIGAATVLTTPAVGPQFQPRTDALVIKEGAAPALRLLELEEDGAWRSQVLRCGVT